jgi:Neocarzinostatin family
MSDRPEPDLASLDRAAATAATGLHRHVDQHLDVERGLATLPTAPSRRPQRSRVLAVAAAVAVMVGMVAVIGQGGDGSSTRLDVDEDGNPLPPPEPGVLTPLAPDDGKDSVQLPVTIEPATGLRDGRSVQASGTGFVPGEQVGIIQCAKEAGGETPETRGGVDGCDTATVVYADADETGTAAGAITLRRLVTTGLTGTVDCAVEANRCIVAIGAMSDYDRSGGVAFSLEGGGEPIEIPTLSVSPADGLADGARVQLVGEGYDRTALPEASVCATQSSTCWTARSTQTERGLPISADGHLKADVIVPRFLPGTTPGTYVDCAVSACTLRISGGQTAPPPVPLTFVDDGAAPVPPAISVAPTSGLAFGDEVVVRGAGFAPGEQVTISLCARQPGADDGWPVCAGADDGTVDVDGDGTFATKIELPGLAGLAPYEGGTATTSCAGDCATETPELLTDLSCDGVRSACSIVVESWSEGSEPFGPRFQPVPVPLTFG